MDPSKARPGLPEVAGLHTYAARGSQPAPFALHNALLRPGGWECAPRGVLRVPDATLAIWA